ncbi:MAG: lipid-A-disaccharide synthase [Pseudomonadota bacterium]
MPNRLYFVAGEESGDVLGREVVSRITELHPTAVIRATGVSLDADKHSVSSVDVTPLSVLGFWEGVQAFGDVKRTVRQTVEDILAFRPNVVVLIDSWGFTLRVADALQKTNKSIRLVKLVGPQVWATRPGRAKTLAGKVDHLLCIHDFEVPFYEPYGLKTTVIGHPALSRSTPGNGPAFRTKYGLDEDDSLVAIFPGSRPSEVARMGSDLLQAAVQLSEHRKSPRIALSPSRSVADEFWGLQDRWHSKFIRVDAEERFDLMAACDAALACSGTITTEIALQGAPVVTGYKTGFLTWFVATRFLMKSEYITLLNVAAGHEVIPEYIQSAFNAGRLAAAAGDLIDDGEKRRAQIEAQFAALTKMGLGRQPAAHIAADAILEELTLA